MDLNSEMRLCLLSAGIISTFVIHLPFASLGAMDHIIISVLEVTPTYLTVPTSTMFISIHSVSIESIYPLCKVTKNLYKVSGILCLRKLRRHKDVRFWKCLLNDCQLDKF